MPRERWWISAEGGHTTKIIEARVNIRYVIVMTAIMSL
jgi:hypothetical protein